MPEVLWQTFARIMRSDTWTDRITSLAVRVFTSLTSTSLQNMRSTCCPALDWNLAESDTAECCAKNHTFSILDHTLRWTPKQGEVQKCHLRFDICTGEFQFEKVVWADHLHWSNSTLSRNFPSSRIVQLPFCLESFVLLEWSKFILSGNFREMV